MRMTRHSLELTRRAWSCAITPSTKLVLLAYCLHANDQGLCWPSLARIATFTGLNQRTVQRHVRTLEAAGALVPLAKPRAATQTYQLNMQALGLAQDLPCPQQQPALDGMAPLDLSALPELPSATTPAPQTPTAGELPGLPELDGWPELDLDFELDFSERPALTAPPSPQPTHTVSPTPPVWVDPEKTEAEDQAQTLARFAALHQRKGYGPVTDATLGKLKAEGELAGLTLPQVLAHCVERRWGTFKALWLQTPSPTRKSGPVPPSGAWTVPSDASASASSFTAPPQRLSPDGELAARKLAAFEASRNAPPATPEQVATHRAKLAALRVSYVAGGARVQIASTARVAMH